MDLLKSIDWEVGNGITGVLSVLITSFLTFLIIVQTKKISKRQLKIEKDISERNEELQVFFNNQQIQIQKRQLKIDIFPYKREIYLNLYNVLEFSNFILEQFFKFKIDHSDPNKLFEMYESSRSNYLGDLRPIIESLRESEYILPQNISPTVLDILGKFDRICSRFIAFKMLANALPVEFLEESVGQMLGEIKESCEYIKTKTNFIQSIMPRELDISHLDR